MQKYIFIFCMFMYSYQIQSADSSASSDRTAVLKAQLALVKKSDAQYFQVLRLLNEPAKLPIKFDREKELCRKLLAADRQMHRATLVFMRHVFEMSNPDMVDPQLLTPQAIGYYMKILQDRPTSPQSRSVVVEFFAVKRPWLKLQEAHKEARAALKESEFSDDEK